MEMVVVAVYDRALGTYGRPAFTRTKGEAIRSFQDEVNRVGTEMQQSPMNQHPEDYTLFALGIFDDSVGAFRCPEHPELLTDAVSCKR